jgi:hypothetical protein
MATSAQFSTERILTTLVKYKASEWVQFFLIAIPTRSYLDTVHKTSLL